MREALRVVDDFLEDPQVVLETALNIPFKDVDWRGDKYEGVGIFTEFNPTAQIEKAMGFDIEIDMSFFRCALAGQRPGSIHTDSVESKWAGILYLSDPEDELSGTAFWTNRCYGWDRLPPYEYLVANGIDPNEEFRRQIASEGYAEEMWTLDTVIGMKYNRFIAYPTDYFHSRYPRTNQALEVIDGRLTWSCFFREKGSERVKEA